MRERPSSPEEVAPQARSRWRRWFGNERSFWRICTAVFCAFAFLKGLRAPGDWPLTQAQIDYSHGFVKRGLQGAFLSLIHVHRLHPLSTYFFLQLVAMLFLLALLTRQADVEDRFGSLLPVTLFASSYAVTFLTHIVGYTDIPLAALTILLLLIRKARTRFWCSLALLPIALLIHESFLLIFLPVLLFSFLLDGILHHGRITRKVITPAAVLAVVALAVTLASSMHPRLPQGEIDQFDDEVQARVDFDIRDDVFNVLSRPLSGSLKEARDGLTYPVWFVPDIVTLINLLPVLLLLCWFTRRLLREALTEPEAQRRTIWILALIAMLTPLSMYLLGVDGGRWNTMCTLTAFLEFVLLCRTLPVQRLTISPAERNVAVFVLALNMASGMGLFDEARINPFPFFPAMFHQFR